MIHWVRVVMGSGATVGRTRASGNIRNRSRNGVQASDVI